MSRPPLGDDALNVLFREARTQNGWHDEPVPETTLHALWDLLKWGPTSANCLPLRLVFVTSEAGKARLRPCLMPGNVDKTMAAPVTAVLGYDRRFHEHLPRLFPHADAKSWFDGNDALIEHTARLNATLQGGYLIMAARSLGLDCGPMAGFDAEAVQAAFFPEGDVSVLFLCNLGVGDPAALFPRSPRFGFDEVCRIA